MLTRDQIIGDSDLRLNSGTASNRRVTEQEPIPVLSPCGVSLSRIYLGRFDQGLHKGINLLFAQTIRDQVVLDATVLGLNLV